MIVDEPGAIPMPTDSHFPSQEGRDIRWIIIHGTAGFSTPEEVAHYFQTSPHSSHYIVGRDGRIVQCVNENDAAWGNGPIQGIPGHAVIDANGVGDGIHRDYWWSINGNWGDISIECLKPDIHNASDLTPEQKHAVFTLADHICTRHNIPRRWADANGGITGHFSLEAGNRQHCPGLFPWDEFFASLQNGGTTVLTLNAAKGYFTDLGGDIWKCSNGFLLGHGLLGFYCNFGGGALCGLTALGLPLSNEIAVSGASAGVVLQRFERGVVAWDPTHSLDSPPGSGPAYLLHLDKEPGQDPRIAQLTQQIEALKAAPASTEVAAVQEALTNITNAEAALNKALGK
ncbi:MAG: N-acetylmuramoyl-L-alanine amidase [Ktedonobacteraceae bacterium]|nr:N-acetylmuramoyl-L-alanine amidase [Ktedonobacteraceae bacterium]